MIPLFAWLTPFTRWVIVANYAATGRWPDTYYLLAGWPLYSRGPAPGYDVFRVEGPVVPPPADLVDEAEAARRIALKTGQLPPVPRLQ